MHVPLLTSLIICVLFLNRHDLCLGPHLGNHEPATLS